MSISKEKRKQVYNKYEGRCAYCGMPIEYKDMQVDHFIPKDKEKLIIVGKYPNITNIDDIENLMPSCRMCNHYKRAHSLAVFRRYIREIPKKLRDNYIYKVGVRYKLIEETEHPIHFYFEQYEKEHKDDS